MDIYGLLRTRSSVYPTGWSVEFFVLWREKLKIPFENPDSISGKCFFLHMRDPPQTGKS
jgi:hypothetical protein